MFRWNTGVFRWNTRVCLLGCLVRGGLSQECFVRRRLPVYGVPQVGDNLSLHGMRCLVRSVLLGVSCSECLARRVGSVLLACKVWGLMRWGGCDGVGVAARRMCDSRVCGSCVCGLCVRVVVVRVVVVDCVCEL